MKTKSLNLYKVKKEGQINHNSIREFLLSGRGGGRFTHEIAQKFKIKNRVVGGIMANLKRRGFIFTYTGGTVIFTNFLSGKPEPCRLSNSYYEWIGD